MTTDGSHLFLQFKGDAATYGRTWKLDVDGTPLGSDPFSLVPLWEPTIDVGTNRGSRLSYDPVQDEVWACGPDNTYHNSAIIGGCPFYS